MKAQMDRWLSCPNTEKVHDQRSHPLPPSDSSDLCSGPLDNEGFEPRGSTYRGVFFSSEYCSPAPSRWPEVKQNHRPGGTGWVREGRLEGTLPVCRAEVRTPASTWFRGPAVYAVDTRILCVPGLPSVGLSSFTKLYLCDSIVLGEVYCCLYNHT